MGLNLRCRHRPLFAEQFWFSHLEVLLEIGVESILDSNDVWELVPPFVFYWILGWFVCPLVNHCIPCVWTMWILYLDIISKWLECDPVGIFNIYSIIFIGLSVQNTNLTKWLSTIMEAGSFEFTDSIIWVNSCFQFVEIAYLGRSTTPRFIPFFPIVVLNFSYTIDNFVG